MRPVAARTPLVRMLAAGVVSDGILVLDGTAAAAARGIAAAAARGIAAAAARGIVPAPLVFESTLGHMQVPLEVARIAAAVPAHIAAAVPARDNTQLALAAVDAHSNVAGLVASSTPDNLHAPLLRYSFALSDAFAGSVAVASALGS